jgi:hypothetical protein
MHARCCVFLRGAAEPGASLHQNLFANPTTIMNFLAISPLEQPKRLVHFEHPPDSQRDALTLARHTAHWHSTVRPFMPATVTSTAAIDAAAAAAAAAAAPLRSVRCTSSCCCTHVLLRLRLRLLCPLWLLLLCLL